MRADGIVRRFDELGRINIPKEIRTKLFGTKYTDGEPMEIFMDKDDIIIRKYEENTSDDVCEWKSASDGYNKALNDFVNVCEKQFTTMYGQRYVDMRDIVIISEQLKAGIKI